MATMADRAQRQAAPAPLPSPKPPTRTRAMTALQTTIPANIVPLRLNSQALVQASPSATTLTRLLHWSESWRDEPGVLLPDIPAELIEALPTALDMARQNLEPGDPGEVMAALSTLASRRGFPLPDGLALEMDVEALARCLPTGIHLLDALGQPD